MLKENQYSEITRLADEILFSSGLLPARVAIVWLHVIREHPVFLKDYDILYIENKFIFHYRKILRSVRNRASLFKVLVKSILLSPVTQWSQVVQQLSTCDVLFVSHLLNAEQLSQEGDFYFADLAVKLRENGYKSQVAFLDHTGMLFPRLSTQDCNNPHKLVLPRTLSLYEELRNLKLLWIEYKSLIAKSDVEINQFKKKVLRYSASEALSSSSLSSLRIAEQIQRIVKITKPKIIITTHEGHAYERVIYNAVREADPNIKCIGYAHAPIFKKQHAVKRSLTKEYNPDIIYTSGIVQKKQLENAELLNSIPIEVLGSVRYLGKHIKTKGSKNNKLTCLVIPEGIESEINTLFQFSLKCSLLLPKVKFIWRLHPKFSFEKLSSENGMYKTLPNNIILSNKSLQEDFEACEWVLYRGSSAVIQSVVAGLKPIYLHSSDEMKIDPIFEIKNWKSEVETVKNAQELFNSGAGNYENYSQAKKYCLDMYTPLDYGLFLDTLRKMNNNE